MAGNPILVLTATGQVGRSVVEELLRQGAEVRGATRNPERAGLLPGVTPVRFDFTDPSTFAPALAGVRRVFVLTPPGHFAADRLLGPFLDAALTSVERVVLMTASGVETSDEIPLRKVEKLIESSAVDWIHLRPSWFMQNFHTWWLPSIQATGKIALPAGEARTAFVDARDVGECAAVALTRDGHAGQAYTLTGPESLTYGQAAQVLSRVSGRAIGYQPVDDATFRASLLAAGMPEDYCGLMLNLFGAVRAGFAARTSDDVSRLLGRPANTLEDYARDYKAAFQQ